MLAIAQLGENAYGAAVRQEIESRTGRPVSIEALCATLARLSEKRARKPFATQPRCLAE